MTECCALNNELLNTIEYQILNTEFQKAVGQFTIIDLFENLSSC